MLEPLITWLNGVWKDLWPFTTISQYEAGLILRNGKFHKEIGPGLWRKIPWIDQVLSAVIVTTTMDLPAQSITTLDGKAVTVTAVIKYSIFNVKTFLLEVMDQKDALGDTTMGIIARLVLDSNWEDLKGDAINNEISKKARAQAKKYGIEVEQVTLKDIIQAIAIRHFNGGSTEIFG